MYVFFPHCYKFSNVLYVCILTLCLLLLQFLGSIYGDRNDPFSQDEEIDSIRDELAGYFLSVYEN